METQAQATPSERCIPRLVLGGVSSGVGKTTLTIALTQAFRARGLHVAVFKCGPDYLDPAYHRLASGRQVQNLDSWMMGREAVRATFLRACAGADLALVEGVMGLFDGVSPRRQAGSTAELARWLEAPVLLVADASGIAGSLAALVQGFAGFQPAAGIGGVVANRVGSARHLSLLREALSTPPLLGGLPVREALAFTPRHLGLQRPGDAETERIRAWGTLAAEWLDLDALLLLAQSAPPLTETHTQHAIAALPPLRIPLHNEQHNEQHSEQHSEQHNELVPSEPVPSELVHSEPVHHEPATAAREQNGAALKVPPRQGSPQSRSQQQGLPQQRPLQQRPVRDRPVRIGIAWDDAFHFYYEDNLARLEAAGAELLRFSPMQDAQLPCIDGLYLGGGYPELHAQQLSNNQSLLSALRRFAQAGKPIYAECGGLMYLTQAIHVQEERFPMAGLLPMEVIMHKRLRALGYVEIETQAHSLFGEAGLRFRGHQFRYSEILEDPTSAEKSATEPTSADPAPAAPAMQRIYRVRRKRDGQVHLEGYAQGSVLATYVHAHWASNPQVAAGFVAACHQAGMLSTSTAHGNDGNERHISTGTASTALEGREDPMNPLPQQSSWKRVHCPAQQAIASNTKNLAEGLKCTDPQKMPLLAPQRILIGGGVRSGKSRFALDLACALSPQRIFVATARAEDAEMRDRIRAHREERDTSFETLEVPLELEQTLAHLHAHRGVVLVDCLTLWLSNLLGAGEPAEAIGVRLQTLLQVWCEAPFHLLLVTNEVGLGIVPQNALARRFGDLAGQMHQQLAAQAQQVYFAALGMILRLRPAPLCAFPGSQNPFLNEASRQAGQVDPAEKTQDA